MGEDKALEGADIVIIPAGVPRKPGMTRDDLFNINVGIVKSFCIAIAKYCPQALVNMVRSSEAQGMPSQQAEEITSATQDSLDNVAQSFVSRTEMQKVESNDAYGLIPELVGRFPILVTLSALFDNHLIEEFPLINLQVVGSGGHTFNPLEPPPDGNLIIHLLYVDRVGVQERLLPEDPEDIIYVAYDQGRHPRIHEFLTSIDMASGMVHTQKKINIHPPRISNASSIHPPAFSARQRPILYVHRLRMHLHRNASPLFCFNVAEAVGCELLGRFGIPTGEDITRALRSLHRARAPQQRGLLDALPPIQMN